MSSFTENCAVERDERWCRTCRHYQYAVDPVQDTYGECRRNAPMPFITTSEFIKDTHHANWPLVRYSDHCGEWVWNPEVDSWIDDPEQNPRG